MNDFRRTIILVIFIGSAFLLFNKWTEYNSRGKSTTTQVATTKQSTELSTNPVANSVQTAPSDSASVQGNVTSLPIASSSQKSFELVTDVLRLNFAVNEASIVRAELLNYKSALDPEFNVVLFDKTNLKNYKEQTGLVGSEFAKISSTMQLVSDTENLKPDQDQWEVRFRSEVVAGLQLEKIFRLKRGSYNIEVQHVLTNLSDKSIAPKLYYQIIRDGTVFKESKLYTTFTGFATYTDENKFKKIKFDEIKDRSYNLPPVANDGFVAMIQHYFVSAWLLSENAQRQYFAQEYANNLYGVGMIETLPELASGASQTTGSQLYVGPQVESYLKTLAPGFEAVKDYGIFTFLSRPTYKVITWAHKYLNNWGWSIVAFVFLLKALFFWLNAKAYASMGKMKAVQPRVTKMREAYKDNPQKMQQEMMKIYKEEKVNPVGGCLPIILQIPFFIALYWVLLSSVEFRGAPWILWIHDLSKPDPYFILPILMAATTMLQTWLNPTPADPMQAKIMWAMPVVFSIMFMFFPSGLVLYWFVNNLLAIAQQWVINKRLGVSKISTANK